MSSRAIIRITASAQKDSRINYSRRMYAIVRRYTPEAVEGKENECFAELTGLRTFFKMSYAEMVKKIIKDLRAEIGVSFSVKITTASIFEGAMKNSKKVKSISTYKEINTLFSGTSFVAVPRRTQARLPRRVRLTVPYLGKVK